MQVRWFNDRDGWLSEGTTVYKHTDQMFIQKPSQNEWNLNIRRISMSFEDAYTCRTADGIVLSRIKLVVESKLQSEHLGDFCVIYRRMSEMTIKLYTYKEK